MTKKLLPLTLIIAGVGLVGCQKAIQGQDRTYKFDPESVIVNYNSLNLFKGDSVELTTFTLPTRAYDAKYNFSSDNQAVATVSDKGVVTGVSNGNANIIVSYGEGEDAVVMKKIPVIVSTKVGVNAQLDTAISNMLDYQTQAYPTGVNTVRQHEARVVQTYVNDVLNYEIVEDTVMTVCQSEAYFSLQETDREIKVAGGDAEIKNYDWTFFTDSDFNSFMYHISAQGKTRLLVPSQSYIDKGRFEAVCHILDTIFSSGRSVMLNAFKNGLATSELTSYSKYKSLVTKGSIGTDVVSYTLVQDNYSTTADYEDEKYSDIPYGTKCLQDYYQNVVWHKGIARTMDLLMVYKYKIGNDNYRRVLNIQYTITVDNEVELKYPVDSEYRAVEDLFDL